jgi:hypothetical protein
MSSSARPLAAALASLLSAGSAVAASPAWCGDRCDEIVVDWNAATHQVIKAADGYADPMAASRVLAMVHLAMHDAVNAAAPRYAPYALAPSAKRVSADAAVAAATAAHDVLAAIYPAQQVSLRPLLDKTLLDAGPGATAAEGRALGAQAAAAVVAKRADDGSAARETYTPGTQPGQYRYTPGFDFLAAPHWRSVRPFALQSPSQFRVAPPPSLGSAEYAAAFREVRDVGGKDSTARTPEQTRYAAFWYEFSDAGWNRVARTVARERKQDLWDRARMFALLNVAMADAYIAGWDSKLHHDFWRPVTAIRAAETDGNPATAADAQWLPMLPTPPVPDHPSTHSALGAAAAEVLAHAVGTDRVKFTFASPSALPEHPSRTFPSFSAAALENADSRVRAGLHFRFATEKGLELGRRIGRHAVATLLAPTH